MLCTQIKWSFAALNWECTLVESKLQLPQRYWKFKHQLQDVESKVIFYYSFQNYTSEEVNVEGTKKYGIPSIIRQCESTHPFKDNFSKIYMNLSSIVSLLFSTGVLHQVETFEIQRADSSIYSKLCLDPQINVYAWILLEVFFDLQ